MAAAPSQAFEDLLVDHVLFYVDDIEAKTAWLVDGYGFAVYAAGGDPAPARSVGLGRRDIRLVLTEPLVGDHPGAAYVERHGDGVADIALRVADAGVAFEEAVRRGARPVSAPAEHGGVVTATIIGFGDVTHTFVQRSGGGDERALHGLRPVAPAAGAWDAGLNGMDHFAICVEAGQLEPTVAFYEQVLDFAMIFTERIVVGAQAMNSQVVQSRSGAVTLTLIEPDLSCSPGQIDDFLKNHGGAGVQHIAFIADDIVRAVGSINATGVAFLNTPGAYYRQLTKRLTLSRHSVDELQRLSILVDQDHYGQLFQIFTRSVHTRKTFFLEIIERIGARTFGSNNIKALYEAVELEAA
ncbi:MAG TPA: 4-hydroxyphenylpyruvate dioxygenase [Pseudonocardiaceae bacterium]|jgi:4-hydroxymandelate synthase